MSRVPMQRRGHSPAEPEPEIFTTPTTSNGRPVHVAHVRGGPYSVLCRDTPERAERDARQHVKVFYRFDQLLGKWRPVDGRRAEVEGWT